MTRDLVTATLRLPAGPAGEHQAEAARLDAAVAANLKELGFGG